MDRDDSERAVDERELIEEAARGDSEAFRALYDRHVDRVYRLAYRMAGEDDIARDITQETFLRAHGRLHQFRGEAAFSTWLHSITRSVALNVIRRVDRHRKREKDMDGMESLAARTPPRADPDLRDRLREAVDALPEIYRIVFLMHDVEGYNHGEIARTLDVAEGTSKARLSRARARLRDTLSDFAPEYA
ncbi:MAG: RNA polymerase sigma factor [Gemmatimonadota bacterium]